MAKPGVMFYFDIRPCLKRLNTEEKGQLFEAVLDYGESGREPDFGGMVGVAWDFIKPSIDRDAGRYEKLVLQKQYAAYARETKKRDQTPVSFEEWKLMDDNERYRLISDDTGRHPTPTPSTSSSIDSNADKPPARSRFIPPSVREVADYCVEKGYKIDPEHFVNYYTSNGWMVGKNKMKDWKAAVRTWASKDQGRPKKQGYEGAIDRLARLYKEEFGE